MLSRSNINQNSLESSNDDESEAIGQRYNVNNLRNQFEPSRNFILTSTNITNETNDSSRTARDFDLNEDSNNLQETLLVNKTTNIIVNNKDKDNVQLREQEKYEFYFQTKIRNSGFWGKVKLRRGTLLVIFGLILLSMGIVVVAVFWRWWYGPAVNIPCRVVGITLLILGFFSFVFGLMSNFMMLTDRMSKHFLGAPPRLATWVLLGSVIALVIASDLMTIYYNYWHNRFVNTPLIIVSIILFFFAPIVFVVSLIHNIKQMRIAVGKSSAKGKEIVVKKVDLEAEIENRNSDTDQDNSLSDNNEEFLNVISNQSETSSTRKDFRKKQLRLQPRNYSAPYYNNTQIST